MQPYQVMQPIADMLEGEVHLLLWGIIGLLFALVAADYIRVLRLRSKLPPGVSLFSTNASSNTGLLSAATFPYHRQYFSIASRKAVRFYLFSSTSLIIQCSGGSGLRSFLKTTSLRLSLSGLVEGILYGSTMLFVPCGPCACRADVLDTVGRR